MTSQPVRLVPADELRIPGHPLESDGVRPTHAVQFYENGGDLSVSSGVGKGATFLLKLPLA